MHWGRMDGNPEYQSSFSERIYPVLMIRLARVGARKQPHYRVVVIEKDRARNGRSIEVVGTYNPRTNPASVDLKHERIAYWRGVASAHLLAEYPPHRVAFKPSNSLGDEQ